MQIAIAGAGIGGLALCAMLARDGHEVELFDRFETPAPVGSGLMLQETGLSVLAGLGARAAAEARGAPIRALAGRRVPDGRRVLSVRFAAWRQSLGALGIQRAALFDLLFGAAMASGVRFNGGQEIARADADAGTFHTTTGRTLGPFDLIVDALGANSPLSSDPRTDLPFGALWATVDWPGDGPFRADQLEQRYRAARQMAGIMPSGSPMAGARDTATYFWSLASDGYTSWRAGRIADWRAEATALWPETEGIVAALDPADLTFARYRHRTLSTPVKGRLVHVGDSWHATSPQLGQGANMALLDAFGLAEALRRHPGDTGRAQQAYRAMRTPHVRLYQSMSVLFTPVYQSNSALLPALRDWVVAPLSHVPPVPALLALLVSGGAGWPLRRLGLRAGMR